MNYKHIYHAGNFADVFKHLSLIICLRKLQEKKAPFFVMDTHSGSAIYNLKSEESAKTGEFLNGINLFLEHCELKKIQNEVAYDYLKIIAALNQAKSNNADKFNFYPGSPYIISQFLRKEDRAIFCEISRNEFALLKKNLSFYKKKIEFICGDGFSVVKSKLPPIERRGLILIDPAFEKNSEEISKDYDLIIFSLKEAIKRFANGIYMVWYPIIDKEREAQKLGEFYKKIYELKIEKLRIITYQNPISGDGKMNNCGLLIINFPYQFEENLKNILPIKILSN